MKKLKFKTLNEETLETLRHLKNPFMIEYIDFFKEKSSYFIVYELLQVKLKDLIKIKIKI